MNTVFIYSLATKENPNNVRYIGKTNNLINRLNRHLQSYYLKENTYKSKWLIKELRNGHTPIIEIIDEVPESEWEFWEIFWISQFKQWNFKITNTTIGGEGLKLTNKIIKQRNCSNAQRNNIKLSNDFKIFNVRQIEDDMWSAERKCPKCQKTLAYKNKNRFKALAKAKRGFLKKQTCLSCRDCIKNFNEYFIKNTKEEILYNIQKAAKKKAVIMIAKNNKNITKFNSIREAEKQTKISRSAISACCKNKKHYNTAGGFKWKYA